MPFPSRRAPAWLALAVCATGGVGVGCADGPNPTTSVLLEIRLAPGATPPRFLVLNAYDDLGQVFRAQRLPTFGVIEAKGALLGSVVLYPGAQPRQLRTDVRGISGLGTVVASGNATTALVRGKQVKATLVLDAGAPADRDDDGVSDPVDNCPDRANPDQSDTDGDGDGDECPAGDDGGREAPGESGGPEAAERPREGGSGAEPVDAALGPDGPEAEVTDDAPLPDEPVLPPVDAAVDPVVDAAIDPAIEGGPGTACGGAGACLSGFCVDGRCCDRACLDPCESCDLPGSAGLCAPVRNADDPGTCTGPRTCSSGGQCLDHNGTSCTPDVLQFTATSDSNPGGNRYVYWTFSLASHLVAAGDVIEYDTFVEQALGGLGGIELYNSDGTSFRDVPPWQDQNGISGHPSSDISSRAFGVWYHRRLPVAPAHLGKTISRWLVVTESDGPGQTSSAYYDNILVSNAGAVTFVAYQSGTPSVSAVLLQANYPTAALALVAGPGAGGAGPCASGHCADGFCCDRGCGASCRACDLPGSEGICLPVTGTSDLPLCPAPNLCTAGICGPAPVDAGPD